MSVQASAYHYSEPRDFLPSGDYASWEIMQMTGQHEPLFDAYKGDDVYPYVPTDIVNQVIIKHGGLAENTVQINKF
jgi:secreted protein with Ig-like and vWFA domain